MSGLLTPQMTVIALALLAAFSVGGLLFVLFFNRVRSPNSTEQRVSQVTQRSARGTKGVVADQLSTRRKSVQETLREMESREKARSKQRRSPPLSIRLEQAGLDLSRKMFFILSAIAGVLFFVGGVGIGATIPLSLALGVAGTVGFPIWVVNFLRKRRFKGFLKEFPGSVDVIVRGVKAGLPLNDCLRIVAAEANEPVRSEFRMIHERQAMGQTTSEAIATLADRIPLPEANFFAIAIAIQQQAGGNLSEALSNLSKVLRERSKMRGKVKAMAMEAKASAWIIAALPVVVMFLVYATSPDYIVVLFTDPRGHLILLLSGIWMAVGVFVMKRMINFDI